jgi:sugar lactone lactonase YvrE
MTALVPLLEGGAYFECPRWHAGTWWISDFYRHGVFTVAADGTERLVVEVEGQPSGLGWLPGGDLLVVSMRDQRVLRLAAGELTVHADVSGLVEGHLNDMLVDEAGRAYAGCFGFDLMGGGRPALAPLVRIDPDGTATVAAEDLRFPNGMVLAGDTLIVAETMAARLTAFTRGPDGALGDRRVYAQIAPTPEMADLPTMLMASSFAPDGCAIDAEGCVWAANALGGPLSRIAPGGAVVAEIAPPAGLAIFACGLGGEDGRTLLACAAPDFAEAARAAARDSVLLTGRVDVPASGACRPPGRRRPA